ncbi:MAG: plastocyanin/azurin family copper-binding protein, partial [Chloroflexota bacterium]
MRSKRHAIGTTWYPREGKLMDGILRGIRRTLALGACSLSILALAVTPALAAATTVNVTAGGGSTDQAVQADLFFPGTITIDAGDSITWADGSGEAHTITFGSAPPGPPDLAPAGGTSVDGSSLVSSGLLLPIPGKGYTLNFPKVGTFNYQCLIHPASMKGSVVVQAAGSAYPTSQATYKAASDPLLTAAITAGEAALAAQTVTSKANGDGSTTYYENTGLGDGKSYTIERFGAQNLNVHVGDTVVWTQKDPNEAHTVTFLNNGQDIPATLPNGQPNPQE